MGFWRKKQEKPKKKFKKVENNKVNIFQVVISRNYRGDVDMTCIEKFMPLLVEKEDEGSASPVLVHQGISYTYIKYMNVYCESKY